MYLYVCNLDLDLQFVFLVKWDTGKWHSRGCRSLSGSKSERDRDKPLDKPDLASGPVPGRDLWPGPGLPDLQLYVGSCEGFGVWPVV